MNSQFADLPWTERKPEFEELDSAQLLYEDRLPLSDLLVAPSGATCCLRRMPHKAEVIAWDGLPSGEPLSWTGLPRLPLLDIFGFNGDELFGRTQSSLLRIRKSTSETLYETQAQIRQAALSPDRQRLLWIEVLRRRRLHTRAVGATCAPDSLKTRESCLGAVWLPDGKIMASQLHLAGDAETALSLLLCDPNAAPIATVLETHSWKLHLLRSGASGTQFVMAGERHDFPQSIFRNSPPPPRDVGTWLVSLEDLPQVTCFANAAPAGGTVELIRDTYIFADARQQSSQSSVLIAASPSRVRAAFVPAFLRNFAVAGRSLIYRTLGGRFGVYSLSLGTLLP